MRKIFMAVIIAISVMAFSFAVADALAKGSGGWFAPIIFLMINCLGLYFAYKFIVWYSKNASTVRTEKEDEEVAMLLRNKAGKRNKTDASGPNF